MDRHHDNPIPLDLTAIRRRLLAWYGRTARDLPWRRRGDDPYAQWLAEMMLQQTQTATVIPFYAAFMARFPTVQALAAADRSEILSMWAGLGYYRRAHLLHDAARMVAGELDGRFPDTVEGLLRLPGVGRYTAGAIASIAFDRRAPILDGNVKRVLARLLALEAAPDEPATVSRMWEVAEAVLPRRRCGAFNQALMDLGATVCTPKKPRCDVCPLSGQCGAFATDRVHEIPPPKRRARVTRIEVTALAVVSREHVLHCARPAGGLWGGMWALPAGERNGTPLTAFAEAQLPRSIAGRIQTLEPLGQVEHQLTHRRVVFDVYRAEVDRTRLPRGYLWRPLADGQALPTAFRKILRLVQGEDQK